jgi:non-homologous end joining protein Ku
MKRSLVILSFVLALTFTAFSQTQSTPKSEKLSKQQLLSLIATAKTSADHTRIADYYQAQAKDYLAQSKEHEQMVAAYKKNPIFNSSKFVTGTVNHCDYLAQSLKKDSDEAQDLAKIHEEMAKEATQK